jgi:hypothetical protein
MQSSVRAAMQTVDTPMRLLLISSKTRRVISGTSRAGATVVLPAMTTATKCCRSSVEWTGNGLQASL